MTGIVCYKSRNGVVLLGPDRAGTLEGILALTRYAVKRGIVPPPFFRSCHIFPFQRFRGFSRQAILITMEREEYDLEQKEVFGHGDSAFAGPAYKVEERGIQMGEAADMYGNVETAEDYGYVARG